MRGLSLAREVLLGIENLKLHKLRSFLTILGWSSAWSVVAMLSVGEGASKEALEQIRKVGSNNIIITAMKPVEDQAAGQTRSFMSVYGILYDDEKRIRETFAAVRRAVPVKLVRRRAGSTTGH